MFRPLAIFIGLRYTRAKRRNHFISFISAASMMGIVIGIMALITVLSVMNGFDQQMRERILGAVSQATISGANGSMPDWREALQVAESNPHVKGAAPYASGEALLQGRTSTGGMLRGIEPSMESNVTDFAHHMQAGSLEALVPGSWNVVLGNELAMTLGVGMGDSVVVITGGNATPIGSVPRLRRFKVVGIFSVGFQQFDSHLALVSMHDAQTLYRMDGPTGIRLKLDDALNAWPVAQQLSGKLGQFYQVRTWLQSNANLFKSLAMEKVVMFIILSLIIAVAVFNLVSSLVMVVTDKQSDIAILRTLGATPRTVMGIFVVQGLVIGTVGIALGVLLGVLLAINVPVIVDWIQNLFHVQFLSPSVYYISEVPSDLHWGDVGWIASMAFVLSLLATLYPAWRASRTQPAQALSYE